jgi:hypothetical protein
LASSFVSRSVTAIAATIWLVFGLPGNAGADESPVWDRLSREQREILAPLERDWNSLDAASRSRWLGLAERYPNLTPERQQRVQERMRQWAALSPEERQKASERYRRMREMTPQQRKELRERWERYQQLPEEQRRELRERSKQKPDGTRE